MEVLVLVGLAAAVALYVWTKAHFKNKKTQQRREALMQKYSDATIVKRVMEGRVWQGQSAEQLRDALGGPAGIEQRENGEIWMYRQMGSVTGLRITLEQGVVVGWGDKK